MSNITVAQVACEIRCLEKRVEAGWNVVTDRDLHQLHMPAGLACIELWVDSSGKKERWAVECGDTAVRELLGTLKPGDRVIVIGAPPRTPVRQRVALQRLARPSDGFTRSVDSRESAVGSRHQGIAEISRPYLATSITPS
jgi:hypothetical protein